MTDLHKTFRQNLALDYRPMARLKKFDPAGIPRSVRIVAFYTSLLFLSYVDKITGNDVHLGVAYIAPVLLMAWFVGRRQAYAIAVASGVALLVQEVYFGSYTYEHVIWAYFNAAFRIIFYIVAAGLLASFKNLSAHLETMVDERTKALRQLASQLSEAEDSQRRQLAHDIHDGFSQMLTVLKLNLAAALPEIEANSPARQRIADSIATIDDLIQRSRTLTFDLHPAMLEHLGLTPTLRRFAEQFSRQTGSDVSINEEGSSRPLPPAVVNYMFRSVKEVVHNAVKHGNAKQIVVSVYWSATHLRMVVDDDGRGFTPAEVFAPNVTKGLGLAGIHERLLSFGGSLQLESNVGKGTRVVLEIPNNTLEAVA